MDHAFPRRYFLEGAAAAALLAGLAAQTRLRAFDDDDDPVEEPARPIKVGLIGAGVWGRELARTSGKIKNVTLAMIAETAEADQRKAAEVAPNAEMVDDYRKVLDEKGIEAVIIATPTHLHKQIALDAIAAGKHVYCEAPLAGTAADLSAIAKAAKAAKTLFQPGLQRRSFPLSLRVHRAATSITCGKMLSVRSQARQKTNWLRAGATPERQKERSWRIYRDSSLGPIGELGIHQIDFLTWMLSGAETVRRPLSVRGQGMQAAYAGTDYEVPDTTFAFLEYPDGVLATVESTIATVHGGNSEEMVGTNGTVLFRDNGDKTLGYLFKEPGVPVEGWEVYAKREKILDELGIILRATPKGGFDIEKIEHGDFGMREPISYAVGTFLARAAGAKNELRVTLQEAWDANVIALRAAEAIAKGTTYTFKPEDFVIA